MQPSNTNSDTSRWPYLEVPSHQQHHYHQHNDSPSEHQPSQEHKEHANLRRTQLHDQVIRMLGVACHVNHAGTLSRMVELVSQAVAVGELTIEAMSPTSGSVSSSLRSSPSSSFSTPSESATSFSSGHPPNEPQLHHNQQPPQLSFHLFQPHNLGRNPQSSLTTTSSVLPLSSSILAPSPRLAPKQQPSDISYYSASANGSSVGTEGAHHLPSISYSPAPPLPASSAPPHSSQQREEHEQRYQSYQHHFYSPTVSSSLPLVTSSPRRRTERRKRSAYEKDKDARDLLRRMSATIKDDVLWTPDNWVEIQPLDPSITLDQFNAHYWPKELSLYKAAAPPKLWDALRLGRDMEFVYQRCIQEPHHSGSSSANSAASAPAPRGFSWKQWLQVYCEPHGINVQVANRNRRIWRVMRSYPLMQFSSAPLREVNKNVCGISRCLSTDPEARQFWSQNYKAFLESLPGSTAGSDESCHNPSSSTPPLTIQLKRRKRSASSDDGTPRKNDAAPVGDYRWRTSTSSKERCKEEEEEEEEEYAQDLDTDCNDFLSRV